MRQEKYDFIAFLDENDDKKFMNVHILKIDSSFVKFKTLTGSDYTIPMKRVLKIKQRGVLGESN